MFRVPKMCFHVLEKGDAYNLYKPRDFVGRATILYTVYSLYSIYVRNLQSVFKRERG